MDIPGKISLTEWSERFEKIPDEEIIKYRYYKNKDWGRYLQPPATFYIYGARELKRLKLDNSFAFLRMWGFVFNESERLFRARQVGKKVIAVSGDLGTVPVIILAFPDAVPFYPECIWWTPFFNESKVLLEEAHHHGAPEAACFSKAAIGAFSKMAYFPKPDLFFASTGASCDDYSAALQIIEDLGFEIEWLEIPYRKGPDYPERAIGYLSTEYRRVYERMADLVGKTGDLSSSIRRANRLRGMVLEIKRMVRDAPVAPILALEMMVVEFGNLYGYGDFDEWIDIVDMIYGTVKERVESGIGVLARDAVPIAWITPSADPYLLNLVEDLNLRVVETEYVINQAMGLIDDDDPFQALARSFMQASLIGSTRERVARIRRSAAAGKIKGAIITTMIGASHCAMETGLIEYWLKGIPVLTIDVPAPFGITRQIKTRLEAFAETIRAR
ncbi:MAG TPA: 2-hydroxyacyl-CoA dehydratase [bacterium (Candidatus Stahlbacteria)]|nr:2-hydroxyacyl-CoA dehydratase [Candidatus Stahlbacteria bacterium]